MYEASEIDDLVAHLARSTRLDRVEAGRVVGEVLAYFRESTAEFVVRRHRTLQADGLTNAVIFECIAAELAERRFAAPPLTQRQIRRLVYG